MQHQIVSPQEWLKARIALLEREKAWTRQRDQIAAERLALPWVRIEKDYVFAGPQGKLTLLDLFQGRSQLYIKHFMMAPGAKHQCVGCSLEVDHVEGILPHLENHDVSYAVVARAPIEEIEVVRKRMGWTVPLGLLVRLRFQLRLQRLVQAEGRAAGRAQYNFRTSARMDRNVARHVGSQHFLQERSG